MAMTASVLGINSLFHPYTAFERLSLYSFSVYTSSFLLPGGSMMPMGLGSFFPSGSHTMIHPVFVLTPWFLAIHLIALCAFCDASRLTVSASFASRNLPLNTKLLSSFEEISFPFAADEMMLLGCLSVRTSVFPVIMHRPTGPSDLTAV